MTPLPYNRSLHPDDYEHPSLKPYVQRIQQFERERMQGLFYRKDHIHREFEYANVQRQIVERFPGHMPEEVRILDTGFGINYFTLFLKDFGFDVTANDSEDYGKVEAVFQTQCTALGLQIPLNLSPVQKLTLPDNTFDVTLCISVIEHLSPEQFDDGLRELVRVTKPGGYVMITSDFFRDAAHADESPNVHCQLSRFYEETALDKIMDTVGPSVFLVGGVDGSAMPDINDQFGGIRYRGDFVNGASFVNFCFQKRYGS